MGSVADLSACIQSDTEEFATDKINNVDNYDAKSLDSIEQNDGGEKSDEGLTNVDGAKMSKSQVDDVDTCQSDVDIVLTSPKGTTTTVMSEDVAAEKKIGELLETSFVMSLFMFGYAFFDFYKTSFHFWSCFSEPVENENNAPDAAVETENTSKEETVERENVENSTDDKNESSEFVNSQGVTFKPTAETVDDSGCVHN